MHIYITRHGETLNNTLNIIGGDCHITKNGKKYASFLTKYFYPNLPSYHNIDNIKNLTVWTSSLLRTKETAFNFISNTDVIEHKELDEIFSGDFDNLNLDTIKNLYPELYEHRNKDKLNNSYPNGENYLDLKKRVFKLLDTIDMKKDETLLIISHQATCRIIYSYFTETPISECIDTQIDLHTLYNIENKKFIPVSLHSLDF